MYSIETCRRIVPEARHGSNLLEGGRSMQATLAHQEDIVPGLALPSHLARSLWRGEGWRGGVGRTVPTGYAALDAELPGGGWPLGGVTELLLERDGIGELRLLADLLGRLTVPDSATHQPGRHVALVGPPFQPYAPALASWGIALERVLWVRAEPRHALWAAQQVLRQSDVAALLLWLPAAGADALRRLQVLAQDSSALTFLLRPATAARQPSPAPLRILCRVPLSCPARCLAAGDQHASCLQLEILKRRGPLATVPLHLRLPLEQGTGWPLPSPLPSPLPLVQTRLIDTTRETRDAVDRRDLAGSAARSGATALAVTE